MQTKSDFKTSYDNQYQDSIIEWRQAGANYKAKNVVELTGHLKAKKVLEVGCGEGSILKLLDEWNFCDELYAVDISESGVAQTQKKNIKKLVEVKIYDGYKIPYPDNHFDLAYCSHVIEHVEFPRQVIREIQRVSKNQFYEVPIDFSFYVDKKIKHFLSYGHINIFTPALFRYLILSEGQKVLKDKCGLYPDEVNKHLFQNNKAGYIKYKLKTAVLRAFPYLMGIKPSYYAVLADKSGDAKIF
ncbi:MAG: class I SAM-dependent methyltransferase [Bacteroidetes bacterium]|nr:class I SAM-dependent methyltransferase [Bacteroidota bacterium]